MKSFNKQGKASILLLLFISRQTLSWFRGHALRARKVATLKVFDKQTIFAFVFMLFYMEMDSIEVCSGEIGTEDYFNQKLSEHIFPEVVLCE